MAKATKSKKSTKARTKSEVYRHIADAAGLTHKQVGTVFDEMSGMIKKDLSRGPGCSRSRV